jgi:hypothetical protein
MSMITVDGSIFLLREKFEHFECNLPRSATAKERRKTFIKKAALNFEIQRGFFLILTNYLIKLNKTPAATAEPITPATLGPIACISKKL